MKKIAIVFAALSLFLTASTVEAYTLPDAFCYTFNSDLQLGSSGAGVLALNQILSSRGYLDESRLYIQSYDSTTAKAVSKFQESFRSEILTPSGLVNGNGRTGPATRAKLNKLYGCPTTVSNPVSTSSANQGSSPALSNLGVSSPSPVLKNSNGDVIKAAVGFNFTVTNNWADEMYIQKNPVQSIATVSNLDTAGAYVSSFYSTTDSRQDSSTYYYIPVGGSRQFQFAVTLDNTGNPNGTVNAYVRVPRILYSTTTSSSSGVLNRASIFTDRLSSNYIQLGI